MTLQIAAIDNSVAMLTEVNLYISAAVLIIGVLIAQVVSRTLSGPITDMEAVSRKIAQLDFSCAANEHNSTLELASLAGSINRMSRQLDQSISN